MNRRSFLSLSGLVSGATLIPVGLVRRIQETCIARRQPMLIVPDSPTNILYAENSGVGFTLHFGDPRTEPEYPNLREYLEIRGYNSMDDESLREYLVEVRGWEDEDFGDLTLEERDRGQDGSTGMESAKRPAKKSSLRATRKPKGRIPAIPAEFFAELDSPITGGELEEWMDYDYEHKESPMARAFHYLDNLPLDNGCDRGGLELGDLRFVEGDRPGSNLTYVEAADLATLACLQHRLNELNTGMMIEIYH
jgi:hypothetical protein